eukprot:gene6414-6910_t
MKIFHFYRCYPILLWLLSACLVSGYYFGTNQRIRSVRLNALMRTKKINSFQDFKQLPSWLVESCLRLNFTTPTDVQAKSLPSLLQGKDVVLQAQTGSGKTLAYSLPLLAKIDPNRASIQGVVIVPTRELSIQVTGVLKQLTATAPEKYLIMSVMEGSNNRRQQLWAVAEPPQIIVGNPQSLLKLVDNGRLRMNSINFIVIDEVDVSLLGHESKQELHRLLSRHLSNTFLDPHELDDENPHTKIKENIVFRDHAKDKREVEAYKSSRQTVLCSATIPQRKYFADLCYRNGWTETVPELINVSEDQLIHDSVQHEFIQCKIEERISLTAYLLKKEFIQSSSSTTLPSTDEQDFPQCIVFIDNEQYAESYKKFLLKSFPLPFQEKSFITTLTSEMNIDERRIALETFRQGKSRILLCSDIASRGIDIPNTRLVIQMALPLTADQYLHRAGRTGRLGRPGKVIVLSQPEEDFVIQRFSNALGIKMIQRKLQARQQVGS